MKTAERFVCFVDVLVERFGDNLFGKGRVAVSHITADVLYHLNEIGDGWVSVLGVYLDFQKGPVLPEWEHVYLIGEAEKLKAVSGLLYGVAVFLRIL